MKRTPIIYKGRIRLLMNLPIADEHKCFTGKEYYAVNYLGNKVQFIAESNELVCALSHEYEWLEQYTTPTKDHDWDKTNLVTINKNGLMYDTYKCSICGIKGKRYGIGEIRRDKRYKADKYKNCEWKTKR